MTTDFASSRMLNVVLERFSGHRQVILALSLSDRRFRSLIEDLVLAHESLERFEAKPDAHRRPEIPEYRTIIQELEAEVRTYLATHDPPSG
jgi:hypothetical protein